MSSIISAFKGEKADSLDKKSKLSLDLEHRNLNRQLLDSIDKLALFRNKIVHGFVPVSKYSKL